MTLRSVTKLHAKMGHAVAKLLEKKTGSCMGSWEPFHEGSQQKKRSRMALAEGKPHDVVAQGKTTAGLLC